ncbi:hypothetical protein D6D25_07183 [Aureobasidium pullulans]|nr:hypothetical protein D6D25_07183 [Aureobasidium pullulans]
MLAGEDQFCASPGRALGNHLTGKLGADGCYGFGIRASKQTEYLVARGPIVVAVKVEDGIWTHVLARCLDPKALGYASNASKEYTSSCKCLEQGLKSIVLDPLACGCPKAK